MKTKVLMVYPEIPNTYWSLEYTLSFVNKKSIMIPLGLITVAAMMPGNYEIKLVDMHVTELNEKDIEEADIIFISAMIVQKNSFEKVVKMCNERGTPVVAGGPYPTSSYREIKGVDHFVLNEAEVTLPEFLHDYENGRAGNVYWNEAKPDIANTPVPRYDLLDVKEYSCMALQYSRGCPFNCEFCDIIELFGRIPRTKSIEQFIGEMKAVYNTGFRGPLFIVDDNFIGDKKMARALLREILKWQKERSYPFSLFTEASINLAHDEELLDLMSEAGFNMVFVGIETPDKETLAMTKKNQNLRGNLYKSVKKIQNKGIQVLGGFIVGFDTDKEDIFDRQIGFIQKAAIPVAMVGMLIPLPNTQLYRRLKKENRLINNTGGNNVNFQLNFIPKMPGEKLIQGYKKIISEIYSPEKYFERSLELLKNFPKKTISGRTYRNGNLRAFLFSLWRQIFSFYGFNYLSYLARSLWYNWRKFPLAVNLAIKGYHFFRITDEILQAVEFNDMLQLSLRSLKKQISETIEDIKAENAYVFIKSAKCEKLLYSVKNIMRKKYNKLHKSVKNYLADIYKDFDLNYESIISEWNENIKINRSIENRRWAPSRAYREAEK